MKFNLEKFCEAGAISSIVLMGIILFPIFAIIFIAIGIGIAIRVAFGKELHIKIENKKDE